MLRTALTAPLDFHYAIPMDAPCPRGKVRFCVSFSTPMVRPSRRSVARSPDIAKIPMPAGTRSKSRGAGGAFRFEDAFAVGPFALQSGMLGEPVLQIDGAAVGA